MLRLRGVFRDHPTHFSTVSFPELPQMPGRLQPVFICIRLRARSFPTPARFTL